MMGSQLITATELGKCSFAPMPCDKKKALGASRTASCLSATIDRQTDPPALPASIEVARRARSARRRDADRWSRGRRSRNYSRQNDFEKSLSTCARERPRSLRLRSLSPRRYCRSRARSRHRRSEAATAPIRRRALPLIRRLIGREGDCQISRSIDDTVGVDVSWEATVVSCRCREPGRARP
jgi:hypothetical protein